MKKKKIVAGLIGKKITNTCSKEIHETFSRDVSYKNYNITTYAKLGEFMNEKKFDYVNVTTPYKKDVIDFLDKKSKLVEKTGVCNLVINKKGVLHGYNTDYYGFKKLIEKHNIGINRKTILILGNGSTSKTIKCALKDMGAGKIIVACRTIREEGEVLFKDIKKSGVRIIINATPVGKNQSDKKLVDLKMFKELETYIDVLYSPYKTDTMIDAKDLNKGSINGVDMLVYQAQQAVELYFGTVIPKAIVANVRAQFILNHVNIVLTGLPTAGKTRICEEFKNQLATYDSNSFFDTDEIIEQGLHMKITTIFKKFGEEYFRDAEKMVSKALSDKEGCVIATGGGMIIDPKNYRNLSRNGFIVYLKKLTFEDFENDKTRPLIKNKEDLRRLYKERNPIYEKRSDFSVSVTKSPSKIIQEVCDAIISV